MNELLRKYNNFYALVSILIIFVLFPLCFGLALSFGEWSGYSDRRYRLKGPTGQSIKDIDLAVIEIYSARSARWRGVASVHTWLAMKRRHESTFSRYEVNGWNAKNRQSTIVKTNGTSDDYWYEYYPEKIFELVGPSAEAVIDAVEFEVSNYPYAKTYKAWPGPNSNTFIAYIARKIPAIAVDLPPTAIGKDYMEGFQITVPPSNRGYQMNINGLFGMTLSPEEGFEINIASAVYGIDINPPAIKLPAVGRLGFGK